MVKLINGDCVDKMKEISDLSVDMVITSPPYDNLRNYNGIINTCHHRNFFDGALDAMFYGGIGGAIGGAAVLWLLSACGYMPRSEEQLAGQALIAQPESALLCLRCLMSFIPAAVALIAILACHFYPLTTERVAEINRQLKETRL